MWDWISEIGREFCDWTSSDWESPTSFVRVLVLPFIFAGFGLLCGSWISNRKERNKKKVREFELTQRAAILAASVCNSALSLKRQHLANLRDRYFDDRQSVVNALGIPTARKTIRASFELESITVPKYLSKTMFEAASEIYLVDPSAIVRAGVVWSATENLESLISDRNNWIDDFKSKFENIDDMTRCQIYFGIENSKREIDNSYKDLIRNIIDTNDDIIFHSYHVYFLLTKFSLEQRRKLPLGQTRSATIAIISFANQKDAKLFPESAKYTDWKETEKIKKNGIFVSRKSHDEALLAKVKVYD